jgi:putative two-component system response regulator
LKRIKIIYVDDVSHALLSVQSRLKASCDVYPAKTTEILYEILEKVIPDLILLDINMPETDGYDVLRQLKGDFRYSDIPVVFLTAKNDKNSILEGIKLGAADYLTKPISDEKLLECIELQVNPEKREANKPIVLAVDDNPIMLKSISYILRDLYTVRTLATPEKLHSLLEHITPDLFLLDYNMPVLNGFDLAIMIRALPEHEKTPIIFISTEGTIDYVSVAVHLGASDFLVKPVDEVLLREKVTAHLEDYIIRRRLRPQ